jgi:hypothetical protein
VEYTNVPDGNALTDKVNINLKMLSALMLNEVGGEVDGADVVTIDQSGSRQGAVQLHKQLMKLTRLCHAVGYDASQRGTSPQCSNEKRCSDTSRTKRRGCRLGTPRSLKWTGECRDNRLSQHQCRR